MSRRHLSYLALVVASVVVAACSNATAPRGDVITDTTGTCKGYISDSGRCIQ